MIKNKLIGAGLTGGNILASEHDELQQNGRSMLQPLNNSQATQTLATLNVEITEAKSRLLCYFRTTVVRFNPDTLTYRIREGASNILASGGGTSSGAAVVVELNSIDDDLSLGVKTITFELLWSGSLGYQYVINSTQTGPFVSTTANAQVVNIDDTHVATSKKVNGIIR